MAVDSWEGSCYVVDENGAMAAQNPVNVHPGAGQMLMRHFATGPQFGKFT